MREEDEVTIVDYPDTRWECYWKVFLTSGKWKFFTDRHTEEEIRKKCPDGIEFVELTKYGRYNRQEGIKVYVEETV